jgi:hypothetical protein
MRSVAFLSCAFAMLMVHVVFADVPGGASADKPTGAFPEVPQQSPSSESGRQPPSTVPAAPTASQHDAYSASQRPPAYSAPPAYGQWAPGPYYPPPWTAPPPDASARDSDEQETWYGWQTLAVDGTSLALAIGGGVSRQDLVTGFGVAGLFVGAPIVHFAHGRVGAGFASAGLRVGLPIVAALIGFAAEDCHGGDFCGLGGLAIGVLVGGASAIALDAAVLAREDVKRDPGPIQRLGISPVVDPQKRMAAVTVSGVF